MPALIHRRLLGLSLCLYFIATWISMAGMEIFGWLTFLLTVTYFLRDRGPNSLRFRDFDRYLPWKSCLLLLGITAIGLITHRTEKTEFVQHFGSQRWMFLFLSSSLALTIFPPTTRGYRVFLFFISVIGLYAISQSFTGIDLLRPGSNRAVQPLDLGATVSLWRSAGLFGSPLGYAYIAGQHVCLALAVALLTFKVRNRRGWLFWASLTAYIIVSFSLVTTFTRGVWIAMGISHFVIAWLVARRLAIGLAAVGATTAAVLFISVEQFRLRVLSLFDANYQSNTDRLFLWKMNWQMFKDYPIFGIGYQENENRASEYAIKMGHPDAFTGHAHNNFIQMLSGTGITGFLTWVFIVGFMLRLNWLLWKKIPADWIWPRALAIGCLGAQLTLQIGGLTECNFKAGATSHNTMMVWAIVVALSVLVEKKRSSIEKLA